jgi:tripartite-type tricarboxylate transporter receptor subunit TctC
VNLRPPFCEDVVNTGRRRLLQASAAVVGVAAFPLTHAQERVLKIWVGFPPGGSGDTFARLIAEQLRTELNSPVIVENKEGAGGLVAAESFLRAPPDGWSILLHTASSAVFAPVTRKKPPYDSLKDYQWLALLSVAPLVIVANTKLPVASLKTFVEYLRANPDKPYGSAGIGASTHLAAELFLDRAGVKALHVPYKGSGPALTDLMGGNITFMLETLQTTQALDKAGKVKIVAVLADQRIPAAPDIPTARELGFDVVASTYNLMAAPVNAPAERIDVLTRALDNAMKNRDFQMRLQAQGIDPVTDSNPAKARAWVAAELARWTPIAKKLGIET